LNENLRIFFMKGMVTMAKSAAKSTAKSTVKAPAKSTAKPAAKPAVKAAVKPVAKPAAKVPVKAEKKPEKKKLLEFTGKKKQYYEALLAVKDQITSQMKFHSDEALKSDKDSAGQRAGMATHMADLGSDNSLHDMELKLLTEEADVVQMIDEAIERLSDDEYGICLDCGEKISHERLIAKPYALYCVACKSRMEKEGR